jgi:DNA-directed RNA polymerase beta subunit
VFETKTDIEPLVAEIKSISLTPGSVPQSCKVIIRVEREIPRLYARIPCLKKPIPLFLLMRALGVSSDMEIT